jgi:DNA-binding MarR family transcriptional regulator
MTGVKQDFPRSEWHVPLLMGFVMRRVADTFDGEEWDGLRQSHFRVVFSVPEDGVSVTELAERVRMTKQGCGQFVAALTASGHLSVEPDPADRRVRRVHRTARGQDLVARVTAHNLALEEEWAAGVGEDRYRTFRSVLEELAGGPGDPPFGPRD